MTLKTGLGSLICINEPKLKKQEPGSKFDFKIRFFYFFVGQAKKRDDDGKKENRRR